MEDTAKQIIAERQSQLEKGFDADNDDSYKNGELVNAAQAYLVAARGERKYLCMNYWPWSLESFKPSFGNRDLEKAAALIFAEIERRQRMQND